MALDLIAVLSVHVNPMFGYWIHAHAQTVLSILGCLWVLGMRLSAMTTEELERVVGAQVHACILRLGWSLDQAAGVMGVPLENLRKSLKRAPASNGAQYQLSLFKLLRMPFPFWLDFMPSLSAAVVAHHMAQILEDAQDMVSDAKASLSDVKERLVAATTARRSA